jgi:isopenicillin N synthase-like dioxygenase
VHGTLTVRPVDLTSFRQGDRSGQLDVARQLDLACQTDGFFSVSGHGVDQSLCDGVLDAFGRFFDLPVEEKRRWIVPDESANRGYSEFGKEGLAYSRGDSTPPDMFEAFNIGREDTVGPYFDRHRGFYASNVWPTEPVDLRETWLEYERATSTVADTILRAMALALGLADDWFTSRCRRAIVTTRANHYVRLAGAHAVQPEQMRMGAHTDYGIVTILLADDVPGLQVCRDGEWLDVAVPRGSFVCNLGDMLERWTNDRWTSTLHRVVPPPDDEPGAFRRRSLARFLDCEPDLIVQSISSCCGPANPSRYEPVEAGPWLRAKVLGSRTRAITTVDGGGLA